MSSPPVQDDVCVFCAIVSGSAPAHMLYSDATACSFLDIDPVRDGHALVVLRRHVATLADAGADVAIRDVAGALSATASMLVDRLGADGVSVFQSNCGAAGQDVEHLHFHLVPRFQGDGRLVVWDRLGSTDDLQQIQDRLFTPGDQQETEG